MTLPDHGTPEQAHLGHKVKISVDNTVGGATALYNEWAAYPDFLMAQSLLTQDQHDAALAVCLLYDRTHINTGSPRSSAGEGKTYQKWIDLGRAVGPANLRTLHMFCIEAQSPPAAPAPELMTAAIKAHREAVKAGHAVAAALHDAEMSRLDNLAVCARSLIAAHRARFFVHRKAIADALAAAQLHFEVAARQRDVLCSGH